MAKQDSVRKLPPGVRANVPKPEASFLMSRRLAFEVAGPSRKACMTRLPPPEAPSRSSCASSRDSRAFAKSAEASCQQRE